MPKLAQRRQRRSNREIFLAKLKELSTGGPTLVGNMTLREKLNWDEEKYHSMRRQLLDEGEVISGRGRGGAVGLANVNDEGLRVFISYSHVDEVLKTSLAKHLEPLRRRKLIEEWNFRKILAGKEWDREISDKLATAQIILLLVSIDFVSSDYCYDIEMETALERHERGKARVIPIILRSCLWQNSPFAKLQALPKDAKAVSAWSDLDEALTDVADGVRKVAEELLEGR